MAHSHHPTIPVPSAASFFQNSSGADVRWSTINSVGGDQHNNFGNTDIVHHGKNEQLFVSF